MIRLSCLKYLKDLKDGKVKRVVTQEVEAWRAQLSHGKQENQNVECIRNNGNVILNVDSYNELDKSKLWHSRLGHVNKKCIAQLQKDGVLESFDFKSNDVCESCLLGKMTKSPFTGTYERDKSDTFEVFKRYQNEAGNQLSRKIKGCEVFIRGEAEEKLETRSKKCLFVGYPEESFGYLFYKPKDNVVFVARRGVFLETKMIFKEDSGSKIDLEEIQESVDEEPIRTRLVIVHCKLDEPANYKEAMESPEVAKWKEAIKSEIQSMYDNQVWNLVDTTPGLKTVGCKWIFKKKTYLDGKVHTYKARLVAKGYTQTHEIDYEETFSLVAIIKSIRIMLTIAAFHVYEIWQMYVKTAFLNGKLTEDVFMVTTRRSKRRIGLSQDTYLDKILKRFKMKNSKKENLPLHHGIKISKDLCPKTDEELDKISRVPYASAIGLIMCAMTCTRPDVSFALSMATRHQQNPSEDKDDSRSQSGWVFLLNGGSVTWKSSKQDTVTDSTCESEYIAAFALTKKPKDHGKSKHIERKYHFVRSKVEEGHMIVKDIRSEDNPAVPFIKALAKSRHDEHARSKGLKDKIKF
nr:hypothetical protein [Tanacetum cinerariifolium]GEZ27043.1 hypothetical protein [Tanacetum cinerariifolium]